MGKLNLINGVKIHESAEVDDRSEIGEGTFLWNNVQVREWAKIGAHCILSKDVYIDLEVKIGDRVKIQNGVSVYKGVKIEDDVFLGPYMVFTNDLYPRAYNRDWAITPTLVKKGASIGANSTIICGITIGEYSLIGAESLINKDVPAYALMVGNPAKQIGYVCKCGHRLKKNESSIAGEKIKCNHCKEEYDIQLFGGKI